MAESKGRDIGAKEDEFFLLTKLISRKLAYPFALLFCRLGISANAVTIAGGSLWVLSAAAMVLAGWLLGGSYTNAGYWMLGFSLLAVNLGVILDVADGSVARMSNTSSTAGYFLDFVFHLIFHPMYFCAIGIFLYLTCGQVVWLVLGVLSICSGWGVSFGSKEHVLCEDIAKNRVDLSKFSSAERYRIYVDSPATRQTVEQKRGLKKSAVILATELLLFPGQYTTFSFVVLADVALGHFFDIHYILLRVLFALMAVVTLSRVPFRIQREYKTLLEYDKIRKREK